MLLLLTGIQGLHDLIFDETGQKHIDCQILQSMHLDYDELLFIGTGQAQITPFITH